MTPDTEKLRNLEILAEELMKADPSEDVVQSYMVKAGLPDTKDPIDRINKVLMALHFEETDKAITE